MNKNIIILSMLSRYSFIYIKKNLIIPHKPKKKYNIKETEANRLFNVIDI